MWNDANRTWNVRGIEASDAGTERSRPRGRLARHVLLGVMMLSLSGGGVSVASGQTEEPPKKEALEQVDAVEAPNQDESTRARNASEASERRRAALPEGNRLMLDAALALNTARSLKYKAVARTEGNLPVALGTTTATVTAVKPEGNRFHWVMRVVGEGSLRDGEAATPFDVAWFSDQTQFFDAASDQVVVRSGRIADPGVRAAENVKLKEMFGPRPWDMEINQSEAKIIGEEEVGGVLCRVVEVTYPNSRRVNKIWLGAEDLLPRRFARIIGVGNQQQSINASMIIEFTEMEVNPTLKVEEAFVATRGTGREELRLPMSPEEREANARPVSSRPASMPPKREGESAPRASAGPMAPDFTLPTPDGSMLSLSELRGNYVVLDFWGTWCIPCKRSSPEVQALYERFKDRGVRVLGLAVRERSDDKPIAYFKEKSFTYTLLLRADEVAKAYNVSVYPTFVVIGPEGTIVHRAEKYEQDKTFAEITSVIEAGLAGAEGK